MWDAAAVAVADADADAAAAAVAVAVAVADADAIAADGDGTPRAGRRARGHAIVGHLAPGLGPLGPPFMDRADDKQAD
jgi:hypothetical protein